LAYSAEHRNLISHLQQHLVNYCKLLHIPRIVGLAAGAAGASGSGAVFIHTQVPSYLIDCCTQISYVQ